MVYANRLRKRSFSQLHSVHSSSGKAMDLPDRDWFYLNPLISPARFQVLHLHSFYSR